ncbi:valine--tRNA ligase [Pelagibius sp.]|uniref:valine--tRNA ligase n=1 Tax=Pelagibius sp. TaxID=1931238 RepID=UPI0026153222|nr:valine--tRNA ligase [Pelagibius sp.]
MLDKTYRPQEVEDRQYARWEEAKAFAAQFDEAKQPYTIMIPPPNVTGSLHIGHALNNTLQDILIRYQRMQGRDVLWQPGTDHAGIATQMVVERELAKDGIELDRGMPLAEGNTRQIGRAEFVERVWAWREESGGIILKQLRRLGASCDWSRERFTMDEGLSEAVLKVFVTLYNEGLIYRDKRLVNWDPRFHTAISDLEVEQREIDGHLWHFKYPIEGEEGRFIVVATTRPETMLGDTAVAVHPDDERYTDLVGKHAILPLVGRRIAIVADAYADPEQGSGAVKITPAHDFNDFEVGKRHGLEMINVFDRDANMNDNVPEAYRGLDRFEARKRVVADMEAAGLLEKIDAHRHTVPHGDRSGVPIEPYLTDQWYVDAATMAKPAIEAVESGRTVFVPKQWEKTYYEWMRNIQPWCISRQLWWGHQIPAWYGPDGEVFVAHDEGEAAKLAAAHYGKAVDLTRDPDVLDTWFSSALWPFSTLGWPEETEALKRYYPGDVLVTSFDIIFFWVARMMMSGLHFMDGQVPFHTVYIHALVRDEKGQKMSKSKGNVVDPLDLIDRFGADAVRFTLTALAAQGRDIKLAESRIEGYRNFCTKIWNAARFCEMNACTYGADFDPATNRERVNRWIVSQLVQVEPKVRGAIEAYRFNEAAQALYQFIWHTYCDWYLEFAKPLFQGDDEAAKAETRATALWVLHQALFLLHPIMPFITEELWSQTGEGDERLMTTAAWPAMPESLLDAEADATLNWIVRMIGQIRAVRSEMNVPPGARIALIVNEASEESKQRVKGHAALVQTLARVEEIAFDQPVPDGSVQDVLEESTLVLPLADVIDIAQEQARLKKEMDKVKSEIGKLDKKLSNDQFVAKAPAEVVEEQRERLADSQQAMDKLQHALERLGSA